MKTVTCLALVGIGLFVGLSGWERPDGLTDEELTSRLVGTWITDETGANYRFYGENSFHRDGMHSADEVMHADGETTKWSFNGIWDVKNGKLLASGEVMRSDRDAIERYQVEEQIERVNDEELVLVNAQGTRLVRHRRHSD